MPTLRLGYLNIGEVTVKLLDKMKKDGICEICPDAKIVTKENCEKWHSLGFNVRAWGVTNTTFMKNLLLAGVDGMTVNFPDKLTNELLKLDN